MKKTICAATFSAALAMAGAAHADDHPSHQFTQPQTTGPTLSTQSAPGSYTGSTSAELVAFITIMLFFALAAATAGGSGGMAYPMLTAG